MNKRTWIFVGFAAVTVLLMFVVIFQGSKVTANGSMSRIILIYPREANPRLPDLNSWIEGEGWRVTHVTANHTGEGSYLVALER